MTTEIRYTLPGRPVTWQRKRLDARGGKPRTYTDASQRSAMAAHTVMALAAVPPKERAKLAADTGARWAVEVLGVWPTAVVGDVDRLASLVLDALEGVVYRTDRQVRRLVSEVAIDPSSPRTEVVIRRLT